MSQKPLESPSADEKDLNSASTPYETTSVPMLGAGHLPPKVLDQTNNSTVDIPQRYRWTALAFILVYTTGAAFSEATLGPLKSTLLKELKINSKSS